MSEAKAKSAFGPNTTLAKVTRRQRLVIQILFLVLAPQTFSLAFAGVKQLFVAIGKADTFEANTFLFLLLLLLVFTVVFGRFFCGYVCAFGTVGDILYKIVDLPLAKLKVKRPRIPVKVENALRCLKYVVLAFFLIASAAGVGSAVNVYSPWTAFGRILSANFLELNVVGLGLLVVIAIGMICKERFFCEFLCPMGAVFSLLPMLPFFRAHRFMPECTECGVCERSCPVRVVVPNEGVQAGECISCGRCVSACPTQCVGMCSEDALAKKFEAALADDAAAKEPQKEQPVFMRAKTPLVVALSAVLLVAFALLGAISPLFA